MAINVNGFVDLNDYLVDIFAGQKVFFSLIEAYNRVVAIQTHQFPYFCGTPQVCYQFVYPISGSIVLQKMYNNVMLLAIGQLSRENTMEQLYQRAQTLFDEGNYDEQTDYVAAMIIKAQNTLYQLFDIIQKTAVFMRASKNFCFNFTNPFITCVNVEPRSRTYGVGLMNSIINRSACVQFTDLFYFEVCSNSSSSSSNLDKLNS